MNTPTSEQLNPLRGEDTPPSPALVEEPASPGELDMSPYESALAAARHPTLARRVDPVSRAGAGHATADEPTFGPTPHGSEALTGVARAGWPRGSPTSTRTGARTRLFPGRGGGGGGGSSSHNSSGHDQDVVFPNHRPSPYTPYVVGGGGGRHVYGWQARGTHAHKHHDSHGHQSHTESTGVVGHTGHHAHPAPATPPQGHDTAHAPPSPSPAVSSSDESEGWVRTRWGDGRVGHLTRQTQGRGGEGRGAEGRDLPKEEEGEEREGAGMADRRLTARPTSLGFQLASPTPETPSSAPPALPLARAAGGVALSVAPYRGPHAPSKSEEMPCYSLLPSEGESAHGTPAAASVRVAGYMERAYTSTEAQMALHREHTAELRVAAGMGSAGAMVSPDTAPSSVHELPPGLQIRAAPTAETTTAATDAGGERPAHAPPQQQQQPAAAAAPLPPPRPQIFRPGGVFGEYVTLSSGVAAAVSTNHFTRDPAGTARPRGTGGFGNTGTTAAAAAAGPATAPAPPPPPVVPVGVEAEGGGRLRGGARLSVVPAFPRSHTAPGAMALAGEAPLPASPKTLREAGGRAGAWGVNVANHSLSSLFAESFRAGRGLSSASFLLHNNNASFANLSLLRDPLAASVMMQQNRTALIAELERRRNRLKKQLALLQREATARNVFALVRSSNASQLQYLLQQNLCNVSERDYNGCTPLHVAAGEGNQAIVSVLLSFGADVLAVDNLGRTPLDCAAANRHSGVGRYLLAVIRGFVQQDGSATASSTGPAPTPPSVGGAQSSRGESSSEASSPFGTRWDATGAHGSLSLGSSAATLTPPASFGAARGAGAGGDGGGDPLFPPAPHPPLGSTQLLRPSGPSTGATLGLPVPSAAGSGSVERTPPGSLPNAELSPRAPSTATAEADARPLLAVPAYLGGHGSSTSLGSPMTHSRETAAPSVGNLSGVELAFQETGSFDGGRLTASVRRPRATAAAAMGGRGGGGGGAGFHSAGSAVTGVRGERAEAGAASSSLSATPAHTLDSTGALATTSTTTTTTTTAAAVTNTTTPMVLLKPPGSMLRPLRPARGSTPLPPPSTAASLASENTSGIIGLTPVATSSVNDPYHRRGGTTSSFSDVGMQTLEDYRHDAALVRSSWGVSTHQRVPPTAVGVPAHTEDEASSSTVRVDPLGNASGPGAGSGEAVASSSTPCDTPSKGGPAAVATSAVTAAAAAAAAAAAPVPVLSPTAEADTAQLAGLLSTGMGGARPHTAGSTPPTVAAHAKWACAEEDKNFAEAVTDPESKALHYSSYSTVSDTVSLVVCMCGLPGRGKSFISKRLVRYMNWKGVPCRVFNAGNYRRQLLGVEGTAGADFFDPDNPKGKELRERMAELACEDLVRFLCEHPLAIGILDATNTTKSRRRKLKEFFEMEARKHTLPYRLLFIESVCMDETIITENILRSKCDNDDFKTVKDTNKVIAEFRDRIQQYEKVYETLEPCEEVPYIKIINVKQHVVIHKVHTGLGSRIAFFLLNLHPIAYPIYIALPGETKGDAAHVFGGDERLTSAGEAYAIALKHFIQDRYVPNMVVLHATNRNVLATLQPLIADEDGAGLGTAEGPGASAVTGTPPTTSAPVTGRGASPTGWRAGPAHAHDPAHLVHGPHGKPRHVVSPTAALEQPTRAVRLEASSAEELQHLRAMAGGDLQDVPVMSQGAPREVGDVLDESTPPPHTQPRPRPRPRPPAVAEGGPASTHAVASTATTRVISPTTNHDEDAEEGEEEGVEEVLCPVPGLDNINYGRFSGCTATWVAERYPRLSSLLYVATEGTGKTPASDTAVGLRDGLAGSPLSDGDGAGEGGVAPVAPASSHTSPTVTSPTVAEQLARPAPPPVHFAKMSEALECLTHTPSHVDPLLAYCVQFPNGESNRQVNVRLEPALMAVMRTQSPVFVVAPPVPAEGVLAFFADVIPELSPTLRLPRHCVIEMGVKDDITVHRLLASSGAEACEPLPSSPALNPDEIQATLRMASSMRSASHPFANSMNPGGRPPGLDDKSSNGDPLS